MQEDINKYNSDSIKFYMGNTEERSLETVTGCNVLDFRLLNPARPGITSFAVQIVKEKLERIIIQK